MVGCTLRLVSQQPIDQEYFNGFLQKDLEGYKEEAGLGYLVMDIVDPPKGAFWGKYNDRRLQMAWVNDLAEKFKANLDSCSNLTAIEVAVRQPWVKNLDQAVKSAARLTTITLPRVEFTELGLEEIANDNLWVLGGNHRREALKKFTREMSGKIQSNSKAIGRLEAQRNRQGEDSEREQDLKDLKDKNKELVDVLSHAPRWAIHLYDRGKNAALLAVANGLMGTQIRLSPTRRG